MKKIITFSSVIALAMGVASTAAASSRYLNEFNTAYGTIAGTSFSCSVCHSTTPALNSYGTDFASTTIPSHTARVYDAALETRDSDGDTFSNLDEIRAGAFPGNSTSKPAPAPEPPPAPVDEMTTWVGAWFSVTLRNEGLFVNGVGLTNDRQSAKGYLNISAWDPNTNVLDATLSYIDPTNGQPVSVPLPLNVISGGVHNFRVWAHVAAGDVIYGFSALFKGTTNGGVVSLGSFKTVGGYHARVSTDEGGWLRITGKVTPEANVPTSINVP